MANANAELEPIRFGRFTLVKRLASGGMGEVFLAKLQGPAGFEKLLVIKRVLEDYSDRREFVEMFLTEARVAAKLTHRNIAQIYEMGRTEGAYYIAMEYVLGRSVSDLLKYLRETGSRIPLAHAIDIAIQACDGLAYAHAARDSQGPLDVIHRDISPRNILLSYSGEVKVIDFGIAKSRMSLEATKAGIIKGKLGYMSPEQSAARKLDRRSDIFSLGVVIYELCSGVHPFVRQDPILTFDAIQRQTPAPLATFDPSYAPLDAVVARALAKEIATRYPDCGAMRRDLAELSRNVVTRGSLADYLAEVFSGEIAEDHALADAVSAISVEEVDSEIIELSATDEAVELSTIDEAVKLSTIDEAVEPSAIEGPPVPIRARVSALVAGIGVLTLLASVGLYGLGQRHGHAAEPRVAVIEPLPAPPDSAVRVEPARAPVEPVAVEPVPVEPTASSVGGATPPTAATAPSEPEVPDKRKRAEARPVLGTLEVATEPSVRVVRKGRRVHGKLALRGNSGVLQIGTGRDPARDPFKLRLAYKLNTRGIEYVVRAEPWAIAQNEIGAGLGRTPVTVDSDAGAIRLSLSNPVEKRHIQLTLTFSR